MDWKQTVVALAFYAALFGVIAVTEKLYSAMAGRGVPDAVAHGFRSLLAMTAIFFAARLSWRVLGDEWVAAGWRDFVRALPYLVSAAVFIEVIRAIF